MALGRWMGDSARRKAGWEELSSIAVRFDARDFTGYNTQPDVEAVDAILVG